MLVFLLQLKGKIMEHDYKAIWEMYVDSWKVETAEEKLAIFEKCLHPENQYNDPLIKTNNWEDFVAYMLDFHTQVPGGHFVTQYFQAHSNKSIAQWKMVNGAGEVLGEGISYAEYKEGKLLSETGFFETPDM